MKVRRGVAAVLVAAMGVFGVGCTGQPLTPQQEVGIGNFIFMTIYIAMCQANYGVCPFPLGPTQPTPSGVIEAPPGLPPATELATS